MRPTKETFRIAKEAASARGFDYIRFKKSLKDGIAYIVADTADFGKCVGVPHIIIVNRDNSISWTNLYGIL